MLLSSLLLLTIGCSELQNGQEKLVDIPKKAWMSNYAPWIHLSIEDSTTSYYVYAVLRHTEELKYENLLMRYGYIAPGDSVRYQELNLPLALHGAWLGDTLGSVVETRVRLGDKPRHFAQGDNVFILSHLMPDEPLIGILQVGIRIEAATADSGSSQPAAQAQISAATDSSLNVQHPVDSSLGSRP